MILVLQVVGLPAKQGILRNAKNTVCHAKKLIGKAFDSIDVQQESSQSQCQVLHTFHLHVHVFLTSPYAVHSIFE